MNTRRLKFCKSAKREHKGFKKEAPQKSWENWKVSLEPRTLQPTLEWHVAMTHATPPLGNNCGGGNPKRHNCQKNKKEKKRGAHHIPMAVSKLNDLEIGGSWWMTTIPSGDLLVQKRDQRTKESLHSVTTQTHWMKERPLAHKWWQCVTGPQ